MRLYTSTITLCDHSTGLNASSNPPEMPAARHRRLSVRNPILSVSAGMLRSRSAPERQINSASSAQAPAPETAEASPTDHAGLGCPLYFTQWNTHWKNHVTSVQIG